MATRTLPRGPARAAWGVVMVKVRIHRAAATVVLALGMLVSPTLHGAAEAVFPGLNGRIAFEIRSAEQGSDVWTVNPDGTGLRQVTRNGLSGSPRWAPSGRLIAFLRFAPARQATDVWTIRPDGTGARRVTTGVVGGPPAWSPRGDGLIVVRPVGEGSDLFRVPLTGGRGQRLTFAAARGCGVGHPSWRGNLVVYSRGCPGVGQLRLLNLTTGRNTVVVETQTQWDSFSQPDFTADLRIMFMSCGVEYPVTSNCLSDNVTTVNRDGTAPTVLTNYCGCESESAALDAVPSPDGQGFAVIVASPNDGRSNLALLVTDGAGNSNLAWAGLPDQPASSPDWQRLPG